MVFLRHYRFSLRRRLPACVTLERVTDRYSVSGDHYPLGLGGGDALPLVVTCDPLFRARCAQKACNGPVLPPVHASIIDRLRPQRKGEMTG